jgi:SNF2 family DNA or RNA helicase
MLTATPVHNDLTELYNLATILKPGLLGTIRAFRRDYVDKMDKRLPINKKHLKNLLSEVMIRNQRDKVDVKLPSRRPGIYYMELGNKERELYDSVTEYVKEEFKKETDNKHRQLSLIVLQKGLCSSPSAVAGTLYKMANKDEYPQKTKERLMNFFHMANNIKECRKLQAVIELLSKFDGKVLIYTAFRRTMFFLEKEIKQLGYSVALFHGALSMKQKRDALIQFEKENKVMISTDAGSEGQNMQFCNYLINYDLPWNPMKVEQRIGRVHRLGQTKNVVIVNFSVNNTIEADILDLLAKKIHMFELVIGEMDLILGAMSSDKSFDTIMMEILATSKDEAEYKKRIEKFAEDLISAREKYLKIKETEEIVSNILEEG